MSKIDVNISIDLPDGVDISSIIHGLKELLRDANGNDTIVNVIEADSPISTNPIYYSRNLGA